MSGLKYWVWLSSLEGLTNLNRLRVLAQFGTPESVFYASAEEISRVEGLSRGQAALLADKNLSETERILGECERLGLRILTLQDAEYPARLRNIFDPPVLLYCKGRLPAVDEEVSIAMVGTRSATPYGIRSAEEIGYGLAKQGAVVVSGMAEGIDAASIRGALRAGGKVISVLACGIDVVYPAQNEYLYRDVSVAGVLLSEYAPGTEPHKTHFPIRNRIISGLALGTVVVEAPLRRSGALITAHTALEQGRDVFVVPGNIDVPTFVGSNRLLRDGAIAISHGWDIMSEYEALFPDKIHKDLGQNQLSASPEELAQHAETAAEVGKVAQKPKKPAKTKPVKQEQNKKVIDKAASSPYSDVNDILPKLSADEQAIVSAIGQEERLVDDVIAETGLPVGKVLAMLTLLEVKGVVKRLPGKRVRLG